MKTGKVVLERALSKLGLASRSQTRTWISEGRLKINGKTVKDPEYVVDSQKDSILLDGKPVQKEPWQTIMLYKPRGVVTTRSDERGRRTVFDLLPEELKSLHPVGRLDMATTGLLLLTNDTALSSRLTDPANAIVRTYVVSVKGKMTEGEVEQLSRGIWDEGEFLEPSKIILRKSSNKESHLVVELTEGKNREIRRLFKSVGHEIIRLKRTAFGSLELGALQPGELRSVKPQELNF
ncbi:MAG TPA: pseudouridine synthase [Candidatus Omnitrophota bacterium]|nr:pseudouridine synthase [Candidatus Omnitrophota bacterium]HPD84752.1 pseudouridine synthase [Candidatus Omnitrophota bacterium]HRZ03610.1 pseudouridine synthase [Candidatus Omnitrophota bacterium]